MANETRCRDCGRRWSGKRECHCARCHNHFNSPSSFDRHFSHGRCLTPTELIEPMPDTGQPRMTPTKNKYGTVWIIRPRADR